MNDFRDIVNYTAEFRRIEALPRGRREDSSVHELTQAFKTPNGNMTLRTLQAEALLELSRGKGLLGALPVGSGKTLITYLAASVLGAVRPLLLIPAHLRDKTQRDFDALAEHWIAEVPEVRTYSWMSRSGQAEFLNEFKPDLIIADEAHHMKNPKAACTRRCFRYYLEHQDTIFCLLTGTLFSRSLFDMHKLMALTLGMEGMPLPHGDRECKTWAQAVDEKVDMRARPGALALFMEAGQDPSISNIRKGLGRRIFETPGILATESPNVPASITINTLDWPMPTACAPLVDELLNFGVAPNKDECAPADVYRHIRSLATGFYYQWDPEPPHEWLDARRHWKRYVRDVIAQDCGLDTELQIQHLCREQFEQTSEFSPVWLNWDLLRNTYKGTSIPHWVSDMTIERIIGHVGTKPILIWVEQIGVGGYLSERTGWPYYHEGGFDADGNYIEDDPATGPVVVSIGSNKEGKNLQHRWSRALVVTPPANGSTWEQMLGRMHRPGQKADEVYVDVLIQHPQIRAQFRQAIRDARMQEDMAQQPRKLLLADYTKEV